MMELIELKEKLNRVLLGESNVIYAILFGSAARGEMRKDSDVDLALKLHRKPDLMELGRLASELESEIEMPVYPVDLDDAPPPLRYEIFKEGIVVLVRDETQLAEDKARAIMEFLDFKYHYDIMAKGMMEAIRGAQSRSDR